jgi:hypothetical protein
MNNKVDAKSILIGLLAGAVVTLAVGAGLPVNRQVGRYQVAGTGNGYAIILDTVTGQAWKAGFATDIVSIDGDFFQPKSVEK